MRLINHKGAASFLRHAGATLAQDEVTNGLMLGLALRLEREPDRFETAPYLATVEDGEQLVAAALMTPPHGLVVYGGKANLDPALALIAQDIQDGAWPVPSVNGRSDVSVAFAQAWQRLTGRAFHVAMALRVFVLHRVTPPQGVPGHLRQAVADDLDLVEAWTVDFQREALPDEPGGVVREQVLRSIEDGKLYLWIDGAPVSLAGKGRTTAHGVSIGPVYTPPSLRRRGYASACVAALSQLILDGGAQFCTLFTDLANPTSNRIYQMIGYRPVCDFAKYELAGAKTEA